MTTPNDTMGSDLADALTRRAETIRVDAPAPEMLRSTQIGEHTRPSLGPLLVGAAAVTIVGLIGVSWLSTRSGPQTVETTAETVRTTTSLAAADGAPSSVASDDSAAIGPPPTVDLAALADPGPVAPGPDVTFRAVEDADLTEMKDVSWAGVVADQFVIVTGNISLDDLTGQEELLLSDDGVEWRSVLAPPGQAVTKVLNDGDRIVAHTFGFVDGKIRDQLWFVDEGFSLYPEPLEFVDLPDHPSRSKEWQRVNASLLFFVGADLFAVQGVVEGIALEQLAVDVGQVKPDERTCDIVGEGLTITISVSASSETDTDCMTATDRRDVIVTPDSLGISEADFLLHSKGSDTYRTFVTGLSGDQVGRVVAELPGAPEHVRVDGTRVAISLWGGTEDGGVAYWVASAVADLGQPESWTVREVPGHPILGNGERADAWAITSDDPASLFRLGGSLGDARLGTLPAGTAALPRNGDNTPDSDTTALVWTQRATDVSYGQILGISTNDTNWTWIDIHERFGPATTALAATLDQRILLISFQSSPDRSATAWLADLE